MIKHIFTVLGLLSYLCVTAIDCHAISADEINAFLYSVDPKDLEGKVFRYEDKRLTLAFLACFHGREDILAYAHMKGAELQFANTHNTGLMCVAAKQGHALCVEYLLKNGVPFRISTSYHQPIHWAARGGHTKAVELLIKHGEDVNYFDEDGTPLIFAAANGHLETVCALLKLGADQSIATRRGQTALSYAEKSKYKEIVAELKKYIK